MQKSMYLSLAALFLSVPLSAPKALAFDMPSPASQLVLRDPTFYKVFQKNSQMRCTFIQDNNFVLVATRGDSDEIRVVMEKAGKLEEASAWIGKIKQEDLSGTQLSHYHRKGQDGFIFELTVAKRRSHEHGYGLPAIFTQVKELWGVDGQGIEKKKGSFPAGSFQLSCEAPITR